MLEVMVKTTWPKKFQTVAVKTLGTFRYEDGG